MPTQKKFKQRVRARQERDDVSYSEAHRIETPLCRSVRDPEGQIAVKEPLTEIQEHELRQRDVLMDWWQKNPGVYEVRLKAQPNEHGTAEVLVEVRLGEGESASFVTLGDMTYLEAIAMGLHHAQNMVPRDDLGNLPDCS